MKALVYEGPWQMPLRDIDTPQPGPEDVIVATQTVGICGSDVHGFKGTTGRRKPPIVMGHEFCGIVSAAGDKVAGFQVGDRVVVQPLLACGVCENCRAGQPNICQNRNGLGMNLNGAYAEAVRVPAKMLHRLPKDVTWDRGAMVEPLSVAMHAVNLTPLQLMDTLVIIGSGTIGLLAIAAARLKGAGSIIVSDLSEHRLDMAKRMGADVVVNSGREDLVEIVKARTGGSGAPAVIEAVGLTPTARQSLLVARNGGQVTWIGNSDPEVQINMQQIVTRELAVRGAYGFNREFGQAITAIQMGRIDVSTLVEGVTTLPETPQIFNDLATGKLEAVKILVKPQS